MVWGGCDRRDGLVWGAVPGGRGGLGLCDVWRVVWGDVTKEEGWSGGVCDRIGGMVLGGGRCDRGRCGLGDVTVGKGGLGHVT